MRFCCVLLLSCCLLGGVAHAGRQHLGDPGPAMAGAGAASALGSPSPGSVPAGERVDRPTIYAGDSLPPSSPPAPNTLVLSLTAIAAALVGVLLGIQGATHAAERRIKEDLRRTIIHSLAADPSYRGHLSQLLMAVFSDHASNRQQIEQLRQALDNQAIYFWMLLRPTEGLQLKEAIQRLAEKAARSDIPDRDLERDLQALLETARRLLDG